MDSALEGHSSPLNFSPHPPPPPPPPPPLVKNWQVPLNFYIYISNDRKNIPCCMF